MSGVLNWVKANIYAVICLAVMIAAPAAMWIVAGKMNASVREEVERRAQRISELNRLAKTSVALENPVPGNAPVKGTIAVNRRFLDRFEEVAGHIRQDADQIQSQVIEINRKGRGVLVDRLFPDPPENLRETISTDMFLDLQAAYDALLAEVNAGAPPSAATMETELTDVHDRYRDQMLMKSAAEALTAEEEEWLTEQISKTRLAMYADAARLIRIYATVADLDVPGEGERPHTAEGQSLITMFDWQWKLWLTQDVLHALAEANASHDSLVEAPVKRLVSLTIDNLAVAAGGNDTSAGGYGGRRADDSAAAPAMPPDPGREVPRDYTVSFTGRTSNPLFDVRRATLVLIVDSARMPEVFDALAQQNFMTITDAGIDAVDPFAEIADGYFYGGAPVSRLTLELETIWLRAWTAEFMPAALREALGIPAPQRAAAE